MKDQYVADIGDYGKYSLLRAFADAVVKVGINWYYTKDDGTEDGKFTDYLNKPNKFEKYDRGVFKELQRIYDAGDRTIKAVERSKILPHACYYAEEVEFDGTPAERTQKRAEWMKGSCKSLSSAQLIYLDPDNGLLTNERVQNTKMVSKYALPEEVKQYFEDGKNVVYYCHKGRRSDKDWEAYKSHMLQYLPDAKKIVLTYHKGTQRSYVLLIRPEDYERYFSIIDEFVKRWDGAFTLEEDKKYPRKYKVITLCGSTRFKEEFLEAQKRLTLEGNIIISVGLFGHAGDNEVWENMDEGTLTKTKAMLDDMHKRKIDMADEIFVINVGGYIGESTQSEIEYAKATGKAVRYLEDSSQ